ncbi:putative repeat protein (TIGR01451 family), partial [Pseudorhizobium tarimense]
DPLLTGAGVALDQGPQTLAPGATFTFTATYTPTQGDLDAGRVANTATATGTNPDGDPIGSPPDTVVTLPQPPSLRLQKTGMFTDTDGNGYASVGDTMTYTFAVTNDGGQTVTNVWPVDAGPTFNKRPAAGFLSRFTPEPVTLAPNQVQEFNATYTLTQQDIENAAGVSDGVANTATATGLSGSGQVTSDDSTSAITLPAAEPSDITVTKVANLRFIRRGEQAPFTIRVTNNYGARATGITVVDTMPSGFRFVEGSAMIGEVKVTPQIVGRQIRFPDITVDGRSEVEIRLRLLALSTAGPGEHVNLAHAEDQSGRRITGQARAVVEIIVEPVFDCGDIVGKVFDDKNRNGYQDKGEPGLPGVRVATVKGWLITTDKYGRFHVACADLPDARVGTNFIMKLDTRTLPTGYRLTTENPRVVRLTAGKMTELNFGASIGRVVRLGLADEAFVPGEVELAERWAEGLDQLIEVLAQEQSVLRLTYLDMGGDPELVEARVKGIKELIAERWRQRKRSYPLEIETRVEAGR